MPSSDRALLEKALGFYDSGKTQEAESALCDLAARYPHQFDVVETLGLIYAERGELERALPLLEAACVSNPSSAGAAANLGAAYVRLNRVQQAMMTLRRAASLDPKNSQTESSYGQALMMAKRPLEAVQAFAAASAGDPRNPDILYNWGLAAFESDGFRQASGILARIPPALRSAQVESLCGDVEESLAQFDRALACFQNAAKLEPSEPNLRALCLELLKHWSFEEAARVYEYGVGKYPSSARLQTGLGIALYGSAQYEKAALVFSRLLSAAPNQASYARFLGEACAATKAESGEFCQVLLVYARAHPTDVVAARLAAATIVEWHDSTRYDVARQLLERAIAQDPGSADGYFHMGVLDQEQGKWSDSVSMLKHATALRPASSKTHVRLAQAYSRLGQKQAAHSEALLARQFRQSEDIEMETKRKDLRTFILENDPGVHVPNSN
jgi:tetratricopeptide (TPR) repeat protein